MHVWGADTPTRRWPSGSAHAAHRPVPVGVEETLRVLDEAGVHRAVLVPPSWEGDRNDLALDAAARYPNRFAVMGRISLTDTASTNRLARWREQQGMLGVRLTLHLDPLRAAFRRGELDWFWAAAEAAGLPVMVYAPGMSRLLGEIARRHPALRLIVDHLALPVNLAGVESFADLPELLALARFPNVAAKASALPCHSELGHPFGDVHHALHRVFDAFGPRRLFWGSDWTRLPCPYRDNISLFTEELSFLSDEDIQWIMGKALLGWLDWPTDAQRTG
ncbi:amidohydrolase [Saccharopolyspora spinosa]|nr:amidohydrolase family protein [Saccharopolyspora spinosa]